MRKKSKSKIIAEKAVFAALTILKDADGQMRGKEVIDKIRDTVHFDEYEKHIYEKTGYVRWESILHFYTIDCIKAGYMQKENGLWILTDEGEKALKLGPEKLLANATKKYREWKGGNTQQANKDDDIEENKEQFKKALLDQFKEKANDGIHRHILNKDPYEFQRMVSHLLSAMGYFIAHVAEKGPDGGIDIIAYNDPLGTKEPRLIVQVKHRPNDSVSSDDIQKLVGTMKRSSDVGIFVTSGTFSRNAKMEARISHKHIELIDFGRFVELWQQYYNKMNDNQKNMLPLEAIYFLGTNES